MICNSPAALTAHGVGILVDRYAWDFGTKIQGPRSNVLAGEGAYHGQISIEYNVDDYIFTEE